jgi:hypothetical protein
VKLNKTPDRERQRAFVDQGLCQDSDKAKALPALGESLSQYAAWLEPVPETEKPLREKPESLRMTFEGCRPQNPIVFLMPGDFLEILSKDPFTYDLLFEGQKSGRRRRLLPQNLSSISLRLTQSEAVQISCELHPTAKGTAIVTDSPWKALADSSGRVVIDAIPKGQYRLRFWHPLLRGNVYPDLLNLQEKNQSIELNWE